MTCIKFKQVLIKKNHNKIKIKKLIWNYKIIIIICKKAINLNKF